MGGPHGGGASARWARVALPRCCRRMPVPAETAASARSFSALFRMRSCPRRCFGLSWTNEAPEKEAESSRFSQPGSQTAQAGGGDQPAAKRHPALLFGVFYSLSPCFSLKIIPRCQPLPRCAPLLALGALGAAWLLAPHQLLPERVFLAPPGWDGPRVALGLAGGTNEQSPGP